MFKLTRLALTISLFSVLTFTAYSQSNFVAGSIFKNSGEIVKGEIDYQEWDINPEKIRFRTSKNGKADWYTLSDIKGFKIDYKNEIYRRMELEVNNEPVDERDLRVFSSIDSINNDFKLTKTTAFLLVLTEGPLNLYQLCDEKRKYHYILQKGVQKPEELMYRKVKIINRDSVKVMIVSSYINQLKQYTDDSPQKIEVSNSLPYTQSEILGIAKSYNEKKGGTVYLKEKDKKNMSLQLMASAVLPFVSFSHYYDVTSINTTKAGSITPSLGVGIDMGYGRMRNKVGLTIDAFTASYVGNFHIVDNVFEKTLDFKVRITGVRLNISGRYSFTTGKVNTYFRIGVGGSLYVKSTMHRLATYKDNTTNEYDTDLRKSEVNVLMALGARASNFIIETRYESWPIGKLDVFTTTARTKRLALIAGYCLPLNKKSK